MDSSHSPTTKPIYRATQIVWYFVGLIEILLTFRFFLKLLSANSGALFTRLIYNTTEPLRVPFTMVFGVSKIENIIFEWTTLLAMIVYALLGWGIVKLFLMGKTVSTPEAAIKLNKEESL